MKTTISATVDRKLAEWIDSQVRKSDDYRNRSHLVEKALSEMRKAAEKRK